VIPQKLQAAWRENSFIARNRMRYHHIDILFSFACSYFRQHPYLSVPPALPKSGDSSLSALRAMAAFPQHMLNPKRTVAELKELRALTGDENGAQRVAFTETWSRARAWLREKLQLMPLEVHSDLAGNVWATLSGKSERSLLIGGHIDSVPNGGWLDGCLNGSGAKFLKCMFLLGE
jgi:hypothetical protein